MTIRAIMATVRALFRRNVVIDEMREEMRFHVEMRAAEYAERGLRPAEARRAALGRFGNLAVMLDRGYDVRGGGVMETVLQDVRFGVRMLVKRPAFSAMAILTLALGIGVSTALFSVVDAALIRPLPYPSPEELVDVSVRVSDGASETMQIGPSMGDLRNWRSASTVFSHIGMGRVTGFMGPIVDTGRLDRLVVATLSEDFLEAYGIAPLLGRSILPDDTREGAPGVALLGHDYWRREFNGDPEVLGRTIRVANEPVTVVGVLPAGFYAETAVWTAMQFNNTMVDMRGSGTPVVGRLRTGVALEQAARDLDAITATSTTLGPIPTPARVVLESLYESETSGYRTTIRMLAYAVGLILLIACVNVAGLLLARGSTRQIELAIRASIGAGRGRLIRQLLTESLVMALAAAILGVLFASLALDALVAIVPLSLPPNSPATINLPVLTFTLVLSVATSILCGLFPALQLSGAGRRFARHLAGANQRTGLPLSRRTGQLLIATEVAMALVLLSGSGLMVRSFARLTAVDVGFDPSTVLTMEVEPLEQAAAVRTAYYPALLEALRANPAIADVGAIDWAALTGGNSYSGLRTETGEIFDGPQRIVLPGYLETLGVRPLSGRLLRAADGGPADFGIVVNATAANRHFEGTAVGRVVLHTSGKAKRSMHIVGVVPDIRYRSPTADVRPEIYWLPGPAAESGEQRALAIVMRLRGGASISHEQLRTIAESIGPRVLIGAIRPASDLLGQQIQQPWRRTMLLSLLGGFGLVLTLVGIFSITAYAVARRTREIGIRMAFGAQPADVVRHVVRDAAWPVTIGLAVGLAVAFYATRTIESFLFQTTPHDPGTLATAIAVVGLTACTAAWIPARRAALVDPVTALRAE